MQVGSGGALTVNGVGKRFVGTNNYYLAYASRAMVDDVLARAAASGLGFVRTWAFIDSGWEAAGWSAIDGNKNGKSFQYWEPAVTSPVVNTAELVQLDYVLSRAAAYGVRIIFTLVNNWHEFGGMDQYVAW